LVKDFRMLFAARFPTRLLFTFRLASIATLLIGTSFAAEPAISLAGTWRFQLDGENEGLQAKWFTQKLNDTVTLPGTTDTNAKGEKTTYRPADRLARKWTWIGPAWYQHDVTIPDSWDGKRVTLFFERSRNTRVWINDTFVGRDDSLSAPHIFDVTAAMKPGTHTITVMIDNSKLPPVGPAHAVDERTQTNWNGIVGTMELRATDPVWIEDVQVYPNAAERTAKVVAMVGNITGKAASGKITVTSESYNTKPPATFPNQTVEFTAGEKSSIVEFTYTPGPEVPLWDEFDPALIRMSLTLAAADFSDTKSISFGMRDFARDGNRLLLNGRPVYLRGRIDCANYPITGFAPMSRDEWMRILQIHKDWGLNHIRYHSWCPPAAAFEVADELGLLLQPELPNKRSAFNAPDEDDQSWYNIDFMELEASDPNVSLFDFGKREGELIFRHYGNSPSFILFTLGNELGMNEGMAEMVAHYQKVNPRALHAQGANNMHWNPTLPEGDDFWLIGKLNKEDKPLRGSFAYHDYPNPHIEKRPPSTMVNYSHTIKGVPVPMIGHETGQFQVSPDFREIEQFTGVLEARNYQIFRDRLEAAGMLDQSHAMFEASGALAVICYREDVEAALRTREFGGFQLLDLQDFPGQGTALVGLLNVFMESKGLIEPEKWREFCSETVPLFLMQKYTWTNNETFSGKIQIAHYGPADMNDATVTATLTDSTGALVTTTTFNAAAIPTGHVTDIGTFEVNLAAANLTSAQQTTLTLEIEGTSYRNSYPVWIYPAKVDTRAPDGVMVARELLHGKTQAHLEAGGKVLLLPDIGKLPHSIVGQFQNEFWSPMFAQSSRRREILDPPGTLGLICDPGHPALAHFPTDFHSNWQWWHLVRNSRPLILDRTPVDYRPIVQIIDNFERNHKLGILMETKVGNGSMLVCTIDLQKIQNQPEARQFLHSLLQYMKSDAFAPPHELDSGLLKTLLPE
jgi:hypothetical protein